MDADDEKTCPRCKRLVRFVVPRNGDPGSFVPHTTLCNGTEPCSGGRDRSRDPTSDDEEETHVDIETQLDVLGLAFEWGELSKAQRQSLLDSIGKSPWPDARTWSGFWHDVVVGSEATMRVLSTRGLTQTKRRHDGETNRQGSRYLTDRGEALAHLGMWLSVVLPHER